MVGIYQPEFGSTFKAWMLTLVMWLTPWLVITMTDYFIIHRGHYSDDRLVHPKRRRGAVLHARDRGLGALVSRRPLPFANTPIFASPLMTEYFGGADLSLFAGALVSFAIYYPWASSRKKASAPSSHRPGCRSASGAHDSGEGIAHA